MKLSEAIREGSFYVTRNAHRWLDIKGEVCTGCAIGAALYAVGVRESVVHPRDVVNLVEKFWPWTDAAICDGMLLSRVTIAFNRDGFEGAAKLVEELEREFVPAKEEVCEPVLQS